MDRFYLRWVILTCNFQICRLFCGTGSDGTWRETNPRTYRASAAPTSTGRSTSSRDATTTNTQTRWGTCRPSVATQILFQLHKLPKTAHWPSPFNQAPPPNTDLGSTNSELIAFKRIWSKSVFLCSRLECMVHVWHSLEAVCIGRMQLAQLIPHRVSAI